MANAPKSPEQLAAEQSQQEMIDKALNTAGFNDFLVAHTDHDPNMISDAEFIGEKFEVFNAVNEVKKGMRTLWGGKIQEDFGMKLNVAEQDLIDQKLEMEAIETPKEILKLKEKFDKFAELPGDIEKRQARQVELGSTADLPDKLKTLSTEKAELDLSKKYFGKGGSFRYAVMYMKTAFKGFANLPEMIDVEFVKGYKPTEKYKKFQAEFGQAIAEKKAVKAVVGKHGEMDGEKMQKITDQIEGDIAKIEGTLAEVTELNNLMPVKKAEFEKLRKELVGGVAGMEEMVNALRQRARTLMAMSLNTASTSQGDKSINILSGLQTKFEQLQKPSETGIDMTEGMDKVPFQDEIDQAIKFRIAEQIEKSVKDTKVGAGALTKLESSIMKYTEMESVGSMKGQEVKDFLLITLENAIIDLPNDTDGKIKAVLCRRIINKMQSK
jgi:hypothetical protein